MSINLGTCMFDYSFYLCLSMLFYFLLILSNNAFLSSTLNEKVFMSQPPWSANASNFSCVQVKESNLWIQQAPYVWYHALWDFLLDFASCSKTLGIFTQALSTRFSLKDLDDLPSLVWKSCMPNRVLLFFNINIFWSSSKEHM